MPLAIGHGFWFCVNQDPQRLFKTVKPLTVGREMSQPSSQQGGTTWQERLKMMRTGSGLVLFFYVLAHFSTHGLGLISHEVLSAAGEITEEFWGFLPITILLYWALAAHFVTALIGLALRRNLQITLREWIQAGLGLSIPFLMLVHVMGTRYASARYGLDPSYTYVLVSTFISSPIYIVLNAAGLVAAWVHGCIGLYMWSRFKEWYRSWFEPVGLVLATLIPAVSLAGFLSAGRRVELLAQDPEFMDTYREELNVTDPQTWTSLTADMDATRWVLIGAVLAVIVLQILRRAARRRSKEITITYLDGPKVVVNKGGTILEASQGAGVPHASVCGGRGRCSTCRVQIIETAVPTTPPLEAESRVLERIRAPENVRLACQLRPEGNIKVQRLLPSDVTVKTARTVSPWSNGREKTATVMFVDLRDFTKMTETRLPFDVVYLINQFSKAMGEVVESQGGRIDKFLGDGFMALFGVDSDVRPAAEAALSSAGEMIGRLRTLNEQLVGELDEPLRMGIGLHTGTVILGEMGYGSARGLTAIGDTVNVASRLEAATKDLGCTLCISEDVITAAELAVPISAQQKISVRGKRSKVSIFGVNHPDDLTAPRQAAGPPQNDGPAHADTTEPADSGQDKA